MLARSPRIAQAAQYRLPYHYLPRRYYWQHLLEYEVYLERVKWWVGELAPKDLLDVGCGDGRLLYDLGFGEGVDLDHRAIRWAKAMGVEAECEDVRGVSRRFDLVTAIEVLEHIPPPEAAEFVGFLAARAKRWVMLTVPTVNAPVPPKHYRHFDAVSLLATVTPWVEVTWMEWLVDQPKWWSVLERLPFTFHESWLRRALEKRLVTDFRKGRHLLVIGKPKGER